MLEKYPRDVKLVPKNFPLEMHNFARKASIASLAGHRQGKFWEFNDKIFEYQSSLTDAKMQDIAKELGLNMENFNKDLSDPAIQNIINRDMNEGVEAGVRGTPTIFVNGRILKNRSLEGFQEAIEAEIRKNAPSTQPSK